MNDNKPRVSPKLSSESMHDAPVEHTAEVHSLPAHHSPRRKLWEIVLITVGVLLLVASAVALQMLRSGNNDMSVPGSSTALPAYVTSQNNYVCAVAGLTALRCQNVEDKSIVKYSLPPELRRPYQIVPNKDASRFVIVNSANDITDPKDGLHAYVVDRNLKIIRTLPPLGLSNDGYKFAWLNDGSTLVYDLRSVTGGQYGPSQLYTYNVQTGKTIQLTHSVTTVYGPTVMQSGDIVAYGEPGKDPGVSPEELLIISPKDGSVRHVNYDSVYAAVGKNSARFVFEPTNNLFYGGSYTNDKKTVVARLTKSADTLKLEQVASLPINALQLFPTSSGIVYGSDHTNEFPYYNIFTTSGSQNYHLSFRRELDNVLFTSKLTPFVTAEKKNELTKGDYYYAPNDTSARLSTFLHSLVTQDCPAGQYSTVELYAHDGDQQAVVARNNCGKSATYYYKYQNGSYQQVAATQEGIDCSQQKELGISKVVLPICSDGSL